MKKADKNHISVVMPVYNRAEFLDEAIGSVLNQNYSNYELIILDDGSRCPEVNETLRSYEHHPNIFIYYKKTNSGQSSAINFSARRVKGDYFCRLDSDDMIVPEALYVVNRYINKYPNVSYFYSSRYVIDKDSQLVIPHGPFQDGIHRSKKFNEEKLLEEYFCNHLICWKKKDFFAAGGMREDVRWAEDWEFALRMSSRFSFQNIDEALYLYREYSGQNLTSSIDERTKTMIIQEMITQAKKERILRASNKSPQT